MAIVRLVTIEVGAQERVLTLEDASVTLGRADDNDVVLLEQAASRHHARIEPVEGGYEIVDLDSSAGLELRGAKIKRHRLKDGDEITVGATKLRFVSHPGSEATVLPVTATPSSQATEAVIPPPPNPFGDADTVLPTGPPGSASKTDPGLADTGPNQALGGHETVAAIHEPAPPAGAAPATIHAAHEPAAPPDTGPATVHADHEPAAAPATVHAAHEPKPPAPTPTPVIEPIAVSNDSPPKSSPSFVMGGNGPSSPSEYTLEGGGSPGAAASGYSLDGDRGSGMGGLSMDTVPPTALRSSGPGVGAIFAFGVIGAAASFGILVAIQGVPW